MIAPAPQTHTHVGRHLELRSCCRRRLKTARRFVGIRTLSIHPTHLTEATYGSRNGYPLRGLIRTTAVTTAINSDPSEPTQADPGHGPDPKLQVRPLPAHPGNAGRRA